MSKSKKSKKKFSKSEQKKSALANPSNVEKDEDDNEEIEEPNIEEKIEMEQKKEEPGKNNSITNKQDDTMLTEKKSDFILGLVLGLIIVAVCTLIVFLFELEYDTNLQKQISELREASAKIGDMNKMSERLASLENVCQQIKEQNEKIKDELNKRLERFNDLDVQYKELDEQSKIRLDEFTKSHRTSLEKLLQDIQQGHDEKMNGLQQQIESLKNVLKGIQTPIPVEQSESIK